MSLWVQTGLGCRQTTRHSSDGSNQRLNDYITVLFKKMYRAQPTISKLLNKKWNEKQMEIH